MDILTQLAVPPSLRAASSPGLAANEWDLHTTSICKVTFTRLQANAILQYILTISTAIGRILGLFAFLKPDAPYIPSAQVTETINLIICRHASICANLQAMRNLPFYLKVGKNFTRFGDVHVELMAMAAALTIVHGVDAEPLGTRGECSW